MIAPEQIECPKHSSHIMNFIYFNNDSQYNKKLCSICLKEDPNVKMNNVIDLVDFKQQLFQYQVFQKTLLNSNSNVLNGIIKIKRELDDIFSKSLYKISQFQTTLAEIDTNLKYFFDSQIIQLNLKQIEYYKSLMEKQFQFQQTQIKIENSELKIVKFNSKLHQFFYQFQNFEKDILIINQYNQQDQIPQEMFPQIEPFLNAHNNRIDQQTQQQQTRTLHDQSTYTNTYYPGISIELIVCIPALNKFYHIETSPNMIIGELAEEFKEMLQIQKIYFQTKDNVILDFTKQFSLQEFGTKQIIFGFID